MAFCLSATSRSSVEMTEQIRRVFACELPLTYSTLFCKEIQVPLKLRVLPFGTLPQPNFWTISLAWQSWGRSKCNELDCRLSAELAIPPSFNDQLLVYHSDRHALSTAWFHHSGLLVTAHACLLQMFVLCDYGSADVQQLADIAHWRDLSY